MATTSVTETRGASPTAMGGHDSGTYLAWIEALSDLMQSKGDSGQVDENTMPRIGWLLYCLTQSAREMASQERRA